MSKKFPVATAAKDEATRTKIQEWADGFSPEYLPALLAYFASACNYNFKMLSAMLAFTAVSLVRVSSLSGCVSIDSITTGKLSVDLIVSSKKRLRFPRRPSHGTTTWIARTTVMAPAAKAPRSTLNGFDDRRLSSVGKARGGCVMGHGVWVLAPGKRQRVLSG